MRSAFTSVALVTAALLLVPFGAMQFTDEVDWGLGDFVVAGAVLSCAALGYVLVARRADCAASRAAVGAAIGLVLLVVWSQLAVGLF
jgi:hypothetical protein